MYKNRIVLSGLEQGLTRHVLSTLKTIELGTQTLHYLVSHRWCLTSWNIIVPTYTTYWIWCIRTGPLNSSISFNCKLHLFSSYVLCLCLAIIFPRMPVIWKPASSIPQRSSPSQSSATRQTDVTASTPLLTLTAWLLGQASEVFPHSIVFYLSDSIANCFSTILSNVRSPGPIQCSSQIRTSPALCSECHSNREHSD
jgi:hypothetical protein